MYLFTYYIYSKCMQLRELYCAMASFYWSTNIEVMCYLSVSYDCIVVGFLWHCLFVTQARTCSRLEGRMAYCMPAWILFQRFVGNKKWATQQITCWKPFILFPPPSTCRKCRCTMRSWTAQVRRLSRVACGWATPDHHSGLTNWRVCWQVSERAIHTLTPTHFTSWKELMLVASSAQNSLEQRCSCSHLEMHWPVHRSFMGWGHTVSY